MNEERMGELEAELESLRMTVESLRMTVKILSGFAEPLFSAVLDQVRRFAEEPYWERLLRANATRETVGRNVAVVQAFLDDFEHWRAAQDDNLSAYRGGCR